MNIGKLPMILGKKIALMLLMALFGLAPNGLVIAQQNIPISDDILFGLIPDQEAQGVFKAWKGLGVEPGEKAESDEVPKFTLYVNFEFGKDELTTDGELLLSEVGRALINPKLREFVFFLAGHTDAVGSDASNLDLSERRARRVRDFLLDEFGIALKRLIYKGYGESKLLKPTDPESELNRRVEITNIGPEDE